MWIDGYNYWYTEGDIKDLLFTKDKKIKELEAQVEAFVAMENDKLCFNDIRKRVQNDPNIRDTSLSADDVLVICQYVKYVWCRDLENRLGTQYKEARKLLTPAKCKIEHEEYDMHGEHYRDDYVLCPNCDKVFANLYYDDGAPIVKFCPNCGQKIDWNIDDRIRNLTDEETDIYNSSLEAEAKTIDGISLL